MRDEQPMPETTAMFSGATCVIANAFVTDPSTE
jgi:hypothetical protein